MTAWGELDQLQGTSTSPTAFRAHQTFCSVHAICQTVLTASLCSATIPVIFAL